MLIPELVYAHDELTLWRRDLHQHPELAFEENRTAQWVADKLQSWGITVTSGIARTGVIGTLRVGSSTRSIGLRADMDALAMDELNTFAHKSKYPGRMHGCGHDGHTVMLLAAARYLAATQHFDGTVQFIFQPAEESNAIGSGASTMIQEGLFDRFPVDSIFSMHNVPGLPTGTFSIRSGPVLGSIDLFDVTVTGKGTHGAMPHTGTDTILVACHIVTAWQSIVSRALDPLQAAVMSVSSLQAGESYNVLPQTALIKGSIRAFSPKVQDTVHQQIKQIAHQTAAAFGATVEVKLRQQAPATVNDPEQAEFARVIASELVGADNVLSGTQAMQSMGSEDFSYLLQEKPGAYALIGNGDGPSACMVHEARYDFNDEILPVGASFYVRLVERKLPNTQ